MKEFLLGLPNENEEFQEFQEFYEDFEDNQDYCQDYYEDYEDYQDEDQNQSDMPKEKREGQEVQELLTWEPQDRIIPTQIYDEQQELLEEVLVNPGVKIQDCCLVG
ncbi:hypothetical protein pb186bvf_010199 [Paramecium bursaria]